MVQGVVVQIATEAPSRDPDRGRGVQVVLDLGIGERGFLDHRPQHRLRAAVEPAVHQELADLARDLGLGRKSHGGVGPAEVALDTEAPELFGLDADPLLGELAALAPKLDHRHRILVLAALPVAFLDFPFDRQAVAVPAGHVVGVLAQHLLGSVDHVLEDLVEGVAHVQMAVGVGRAVMQQELLTPLCGLAQAREQVHLVPARQNLRLALGQSGAHGKFGARQENRGFVIDAHRFGGPGTEVIWGESA
jgi:hypothetical protein